MNTYLLDSFLRTKWYKGGRIVDVIVNHDAWTGPVRVIDGWDYDNA